MPDNGTNPTPNPSDAHTAPSGPLLLADLTTDETAAIRDDIDLVLIPVGAHEQHGPALPVSTDTISAQVICGLLGTIMRPRIAIAPAIPWGVSWAHLDRPGTISLQPETLIAIVRDTVASLSQHGFRRFMLVNGHGGNTATLRLAAEQCRQLPGAPLVIPVFAYRLIAQAAREVLGEHAIGHGGGDEASVMLTARPDLVHREFLQNPPVHNPLRLMSQLLGAVDSALPIMQSAYSSTGTTGDASQASAEAGQAILGQVTNQMRAIIEQLLETPVP
jgi:creatinine amidohydrolase